MIIEAPKIKGIKATLDRLDEAASSLGFVRWQWEYYRATYDFKYEDPSTGEDYYLRVNARVESGKLESPYAVLRLEDAYVGKATFPHGLDYNAPIPEAVLKTSKQKLQELERRLSA